jgi:hypothetical protein
MARGALLRIPPSAEPKPAYPMDYLAPLAILAITQLLAAISPGQSFVLISKLALSSNRVGCAVRGDGAGAGHDHLVIGSHPGGGLAAQVRCLGLYRLQDRRRSISHLAGGNAVASCPRTSRDDQYGAKACQPCTRLRAWHRNPACQPQGRGVLRLDLCCAAARPRACMGLRDRRRDRVPQRDRLVFGGGAGVLVRPPRARPTCGQKSGSTG